MPTTSATKAIPIAMRTLVVIKEPAMLEASLAALGAGSVGTSRDSTVEPAMTNAASPADTVVCR